MRHGSSLESNNTTTRQTDTVRESRRVFLLVDQIFYLDSFSRNLGQRCTLPVLKKKEQKDDMWNYNQTFGITKAT